jgi:hypothetical protein
VIIRYAAIGFKEKVECNECPFFCAPYDGEDATCTHTSKKIPIMEDYAGDFIMDRDTGKYQLVEDVPDFCELSAIPAIWGEYIND